jgi:TetR/AcrR family transcriptional repressor of nem operon
VAKRYWEDTARVLESLSADHPEPAQALHAYPHIFRKSLENENRLCLCSFMAAEYDDLPDPVKVEVQAFADVNVAWLEKTLIAANANPEAAGKQARASFSAIAGAQLMARSRADLALFDGLVETYRSTGLLPA